MNKNLDRDARFAVVNRIAKAMAYKNGDPILGATNILTKSEHSGHPRTPEELDKGMGAPAAIQADGARFYSHVRSDGRGQINIVWPSGVEVTYKFYIPEEFLRKEREQENLLLTREVLPAGDDIHSTTDLDKLIDSIKKSDSAFPTKVSDIPSFPYVDFDDFKHAVRTGTCTVNRFAFRQEPTFLSLLAPKITQYLHTSAVLFAFASPLISIALAIFVSPWWLLGVIGFFLGFKKAKSIYNNAVLSSALISEKAFCFLFYVSQISIYHHTQKREIEWKMLKQNA